MSSRTLCITLLASEWKSSKGGLSTINRQLAIHLAKNNDVSVSFFVPKCCDDDKREASSHKVRILEAKNRPGYEPVDWLAYPPKDLVIDFVVGHGVVLGKQAQIIKDSHHCKWIQVIHTAPDELAMYKSYSDAISKGENKQWAELELCKMANLVVAVGPKLKEFYSAYLNACGKKVYSFTPGIFTEFSSLKSSFQSGKKFRLLVFGRGDTEDFQLKGYDIAAQAVAKLNDKSYILTFVGASKGSENQVTNELLNHGLDRSQLIVKGYLENREYLTTVLCASNLVVVPSRTEGFGLTALEALSCGVPFIVSQNSGFGEALNILGASDFIVDSEDPEHWAAAIRRVRQKGNENAVQECRKLRTRYAEKYSWETQCNKLVTIMLSLGHNQPSSDPLNRCATRQTERDNSAQLTTRKNITRLNPQVMRPREKSSSSRESVSTGSVELTGSVSSSSSLLEFVSEVELREKQPLVSSKRKQLSVSHETPAKASKTGSDPSSSWYPISHKELQGKVRQEKPSTSSETKQVPNKKTVKALAVLGCKVSNESMQAVTDALKVADTTVNLLVKRQYTNPSPTGVKEYLKQNLSSFRSCMLFVDAEAVKRANQGAQLDVEYEELFKTALDKVAEKVIILVCSDSTLSPRDEGIVQRSIDRVVEERRKGFIAWLKNGTLTVDPDVLAQVLNSASTLTEIMPPRSPPKDVKSQSNVPSISARKPRQIYVDETEGYPVPPEGTLLPPTDGYWFDPFSVQRQKSILALQEPHPTSVSKSTGHTASTGNTVLDWSKLRYGRISYQSAGRRGHLDEILLGEIRLLQTESKVRIPDNVKQDLFKQFCHTSEADVTIVSEPHDKDALRWFVEEKSRDASEMAENEVLMLKTSVRYGQVSMEIEDLRYRYPDWTVPQSILEKIRDEYAETSNGELNIISDEKGNLRYHVLNSHGLQLPPYPFRPSGFLRPF